MTNKERLFNEQMEMMRKLITNDRDKPSVITEGTKKPSLLNEGFSADGSYDPTDMMKSAIGIVLKTNFPRQMGDNAKRREYINRLVSSTDGSVEQIKAFLGTADPQIGFTVKPPYDQLVAEKIADILGAAKRPTPGSTPAVTPSNTPSVTPSNGELQAPVVSLSSPLAYMAATGKKPGDDLDEDDWQHRDNMEPLYRDLPHGEPSESGAPDHATLMSYAQEYADHLKQYIDPKSLNYQEFSDGERWDLEFHLNIPKQAMMPSSTPEEVEADVKKEINFNSHGIEGNPGGATSRAYVMGVSDAGSHWTVAVSASGGMDI